MGDKLRALFARAHAKGGAALAAKLVLKTGLTTQRVATMPDTPEKVMLVTRALEDLLKAASTADAAPLAGFGSGNGVVKRCFDVAKQHGGLPLAIKLAAKTGLSSASADTPEGVERTRKALAELLPGVDVPG